MYKWFSVVLLLGIFSFKSPNKDLIYGSWISYESKEKLKDIMIFKRNGTFELIVYLSKDDELDTIGFTGNFNINNDTLSMKLDSSGVSDRYLIKKINTKKLLLANTKKGKEFEFKKTYNRISKF